MNHIYKTIYNPALGTWIAVPEIARNGGKKSRIFSVNYKNVVCAAVVSISLYTAIPSVAANAGISNGTGQTALAINPNGGSANASGNASIAAGLNADSKGQYSIAIGREAVAAQNENIAIGNQAIANTDGDRHQQTIAIGSNANATGQQAVALGQGTKAKNKENIAIGNAAEATGRQQVIAIGAAVSATGDQSTAIGNNTTVSGDSSIAIGGDDLDSVSKKNGVYNASDTALKYNELTGDNLIGGTRYVPTAASGGASVAVGVQSTAEGNLSTAFGTKTAAKGAASVALGTGSYADKDNAIALGAGSRTDNDAKGVNNATIGSIIYSGFAGGADIKVGDQVSVGKQGFERQIKNVAPGEISNTSTDAINGSQLYSVVTKLQEADTHYYHMNSTDQSAGSNYNNDGATGKNALAVGLNAKAQATESIAILGTTEQDDPAIADESSIAIGRSSHAKGKGATALGINTDATGRNALALGDAAKGLSAQAIAIGNQANVAKSGAGSISIGSASKVTGARSVATGVLADAKANNSVALGSYSVADRVNSVVGSATASSPTVGTTVYANDNASAADKAAVSNTVAGDLGALSIGTTGKTRQIINVAAGAADSDAVNVAQLKAVANAAAASATHYYSVKGSATTDGNYNNDGATGTNALAAGVGVTAAGNNAVAIGSSAKAGQDSSIAIGDKAVIGTTTGDSTGAITVGLNSSADGKAAVAIGSEAVANKNHTIALGVKAQSTAEGSVALGQNSGASGANAIAIGSLSKASNSTASAFGASSNAAGSAATAIGNSSVASAGNTTAIGTSAKAINTSATALGDSANASGSSSTALGSSAAAAGDGALAVGNGANASGWRGTAIGIDSKATASKSLAIGDTSQVSGGESVAIGVKNNVSGESSGALGQNNTVAQNNTFVIGNGVTTSQANSVVLGNASSDRAATAVNNATVGTIIYAGFAGVGSASNGVVSIGSSGKERQLINVAAGEISATSTDAINGSQLHSVVTKLQAADTHYYSVKGSATTDGNYNNDGATGTHALAAGVNAAASGDHSVAVGSAAQAKAAGAMAVGNDAIASGVDSLANGKASKAEGQGSTAVGNTAQALELSATAVGNNALAEKKFTTAVGAGSQAKGGSSTALGNDAHATEWSALALGRAAEATSNSSIAIGEEANSSAETAVVIGKQAKATFANSVALGAGSVDRAATTETQATVNGITYSGFAGQGSTANGVVSVGDSGKERQVVNVAAGKIAADSTDAINGSQLYLTQQALGNVASTTATHLGGGATLGTDGKITAPTYAITNPANSTTTNYNNVGSALGALSTAVNTPLTFAGDSGTSSQRKLGSTVTVKGGVTDATKLSDNNIGVVSDGNGTLNVKLAKNITVDSVKAGNTTINSNGLTINNGPSVTSAGINAAGNKVTNVAAGTDDTDAVNVAQLKALATKTETTPLTNTTTGTVNVPTGTNATKLATASDIANAINNSGFTLTTAATTNGEVSGSSTELVNPGETVTIEADKNIKVSQANGKVTIATKDDVSFNSVTAGSGANQVVLGSDGVKVGGNTYINNNGLNANNKKVTNVADGTAPTDAVNVSQLNAKTSAAKTEVKEGSNTKVVKTTDATDGHEIYTVHADKAITAGKTGETVVTNNTTTSATGEKEVTYTVGLDTKVKDDIAKGVDAKNIVDNQGLTFTGDSGDTGMKKLGDTVAVKGDSNIVTKADSNGVNITLKKDITVDSVKAGYTTVNNNGLTINNGPSVTKTGIDAANNKITNVANGTAPTDAVNVSQLNTQVAASKEEVKSTDRSVTINTTQNGSGANVYNLSVNVDGDTIVKDGNGALKASTTSLTVGSNGSVATPTNPSKLVNAGDIANAINQSGFTVTSSASEGEVSGTSQNLVKPGNTVTFDAGKNIKVTQDNGKFTFATKDDVSFNSVKAGDTTINNNGVTITGGPSVTKTGVDAANQKVTHVSNGDVSNASKDAVNGSQLFNQGEGVKNIIGGNTTYNPTTGAFTNTDIGGTGKGNIDDAIRTVNNKVNLGWNVQTNGGAKENVAAGDTVNFKNGSNIVINNTGKDITIATSPDLKADSLTINNGPIINSGGINMGGKGITNLADGNIAAGSQDAVTGGQLYQTNQNVTNNATNIAKGINFGGNSGPSANKYNLGDTMVVNGDNNVTSTTVAGGVQLALSPNLNVTSIITTDAVGNKTVTNGGGVTITPTGGGSPVSLSTGGLNNGGNKITNVAAGDVSPTSTDAVNGSQLDAAKTRYYSVNDNGTKVDNYQNDGATGNNALAAGTQASASGEGAVAVGDKATATVKGGVAVGAESDADRAALTGVTKDSVTDSASAASNQVFAIDTATDADKQAIADTVKGDLGAFSVGDAGHTRQIINVAAGSEDSDAVNVSQLRAVANKARGTTVVQNHITQIVNNTTVSGGKNIKVNKRGDNYQVALADDVETNSVTTGDTRIDNNGLHVKGNTYVDANGLNANNQVVRNVAPGRVAEDSSDAVNGAQLYALGQQLDGMNKYINSARAGVASAIATAGLPQAYRPGASMVAAAGGYYDGQSAVAVGMSTISDNGKWIIKGAANVNSKEAGASIGVGYQW
ncbi:MAG: YadA-like family protein [Cardiobacteriaceae bacterium]|nr:YadA-like family protein [Cardiobacteriaceae bacterium]